MIYIETERLFLRSWKSEDLPPFIAMNKDKRVMRYYDSPLAKGMKSQALSQNLLF